MVRRSEGDTWDEESSQFISPQDAFVPASDLEEPNHDFVPFDQFLQLNFGKAGKKKEGKEVQSRPGNSTMQDPNYNADEADSVATGEAAAAADRLRKSMRGAKPKGSAAHNPTDHFDPLSGQTSIGGSWELEGRWKPPTQP